MRERMMGNYLFDIEIANSAVSAGGIGINLRLASVECFL